MPRIAITVGDVAGIGPEISLAAIADPAIAAICDPILYGPRRELQKLAQRFDNGIDIQTVDIPVDAAIPVRMGCHTGDTGRASYQAVCQAIDDAVAGKVDAVVTGPIQKEAWQTANVGYTAHTELFADRTGTTDYAMMLAGDELACILVTVHIPLADVASRLTTEGIVRAIRLATPVAQVRGTPLGRAVVAVCGLNPHAGEHGLMSHHEEETIIAPAIEIARREGIDVLGPLPPDTAFTPAMRKRVDAYVCMYHDQGLIPLKALEFDHGINVTLGLPIIRTSVDHGTAMDLAGRGVANPSSMKAAIRYAVELCAG